MKVSVDCALVASGEFSGVYMNIVTLFDLAGESADDITKAIVAALPDRWMDFPLLLVGLGVEDRISCSMNMGRRGATCVSVLDDHLGPFVEVATGRFGALHYGDPFPPK